MKTKYYFITGTDTGVGKTHFTCLFINELQRQNYRVMAYKPISCGCDRTESGLRHPDALAFQNALRLTTTYENINPWVFAPPIAPHIAAQQTQVHLQAGTIAQHCQQSSAEIVLVEGAGGWCVPINDHETMADIAMALQAEVIVVVGLRLGCLNHSLLTVESILRRSPLKIAGWVANQIDPNMAASNENIDTLTRLIPAPLLANIPFCQADPFLTLAPKAMESITI